MWVLPELTGTALAQPDMTEGQGVSAVQRGGGGLEGLEVEGRNVGSLWCSPSWCRWLQREHCASGQ